MTNYPHMAGATGSGVYHPEEPRVDGIHAYWSGRDQGLEPRSRVLY